MRSNMRQRQEHVMGLQNAVTGANGWNKPAAFAAALMKDLVRERYLHLMILPAVISLVVFCYVPMFGVQIAFRDYMFNKGIIGSPWVGLKHFKDFIIDPNIGNVIVNTLGISALKVFFLFPLPIVLALSLNEVGNAAFKRVSQTISYFPYFISWAIVALMAVNWLSPSVGFVNRFLVAVGILDKPYLFLGDANAFWWISLALEAWKNTGWASIIYLAAIAGIDQEMYEAATIDGANRFQKMRKITLPSILGTIMVLLILNIGNILSGGLYASNFQVSYLLGNPMNLPKSEIIDTYILKIGISLGRYSYAAAVGLLSSVVSFILLFLANLLSKKATDESFF
jgi:putative aldouronate transport system permease protein